MKKLKTANNYYRQLLDNNFSVTAIYIVLLFAGIENRAVAQNPVNHIRVWDALAPETNAATLAGRPVTDARQTTQYFDGLGRLIQTVVKQGSMISGQNPVDMVQPVVYDAFGREADKYLPYPAAIADGLLKSNPLTAQAAFYNGTDPAINPLAGQGETHFYSKNLFEPSPFNRVTKTMAPGISWNGAGRGVEQNYVVNTNTDAVRVFTVTDASYYGGFGTYSTGTIYAQGALFKNIVKDEHGKQVIEFKDKDGRVILKKVQLTAGYDSGLGSSHTGWLCTYYIYDDYSRLRCVIQPEGVKALEGNSWNLTTTLLSEQCFRYEYDQRSHMIMKKVPGAGEVYMVYDARDRLVLTQDANLRSQYKWAYTQYDELNRPKVTGLVTDIYYYQSLSFHIPQAENIINYPNAANWWFSNYDVLTQTYYDDYSWLGGTGLGSFNSSHGSGAGFYTASTTAYPYAESTSANSTATKGLVTGTKTKVLDGGSTHLYTVTYYDAKGRPLQMQSTNINSGVDVTTTQYSFSGQVLASRTTNNSPGLTPASIDVSTRYLYDALGRQVKTEKAINNTGFKKTTEILYNALSQVSNKKLGTNPASPANPLESLAYRYNIRGWLLTTNKDYVEGTSTSNWFGQKLQYNTDAATVQYNGNIAANHWRSGDDNVRRKYEYGYDAANRLLRADYRDWNGSSWINNGTYDYTTIMGDGSNADNAYDGNGNIKRMQHYRAPSVKIDDLGYTYNGGSNKLLSVTDVHNNPSSTLGDFKEISSGAYQDYWYDANGNLTRDDNKGISSITYNYQNLPQTITVTGKGSIGYVYDAAGNKHKKTVTEGATTTTTIYRNGLEYSNGILRQAAHEEGRMRRREDGSFAWDYYVKDHLGSVRVTLTEEQMVDVYYMAGMEPANAETENALYSSIEQTRAAKPQDYPQTDSTDAYAAKLNGKTQKTGPALLLKVTAGDKISIKAESWYREKQAEVKNKIETKVPAEALAAELIKDVAVQGKEAATALSNPLLPAVTAFLKNRDKEQGNLQLKPKAYLNWILLDNQLQAMPEDSIHAETRGYLQVGNPGELKQLVKDEWVVTKSGYVYIYVSNESEGTDVFFDNMLVSTLSGPLLETNHTYPFGLTMKGISTQAPGALENKKRFNGIEQTTDLELNQYDAFFRTMDPQIGRWWQIDPKPTVSESLYAIMANNPISNNDPLGDTAIVRWRSGFLGLGRRREARYVGDQWIDSKTRKAVDIDNVSKAAKRMMNDYNGLNQISDFDPVTDKINTNGANVVLTSAKEAEADPISAFRSGSSKELIVNLSGSRKLRAELNVGNVSVTLNSQQIMGHELGHVFDILGGKPLEHFQRVTVKAGGYVGITIAPSEINAMYWENILRAKAGLPLRSSYFYHRNPRVSWNSGDAIIKYDPKTGQPISVSDLDGNNYIIKK